MGCGNVIRLSFAIVPRVTHISGPDEPPGIQMPDPTVNQLLPGCGNSFDVVVDIDLSLRLGGVSAHLLKPLLLPTTTTIHHS
jgi:hypothetical protein